VDHADHVRLLRPGIPSQGGTWADLGAGTGAFSLALADLLGPEATIHLVDRDGRALATNRERLAQRFPSAHVTTHVADFTDGLPLEPGTLDGLVMANSLHFVRDKPAPLRRIITSIRPGGRFILVEYGSDQGNPWVPWPLSYRSWERLAAEVGLAATRQLGAVPSRFLGSIYSAGSDVPGDRG
jgi:ubiquinone/menaquinone biosynthesis C-methylase UbiE